MKRLIVVLTLLLSQSFVWADLTVKSKDHVQNTPEGLCAWCSIESLALANGYESIRGLRATKSKPGHGYELETKLMELKIPFTANQAKTSEWWYYIWEQSGNNPAKLVRMVQDKDEALKIIKRSKGAGHIYWVEDKYHWDSKVVREAVAKDYGAAVVIQRMWLNNNKWELSKHMLVITHWDEREVWFCDSNYSPGHTRKMPADDFLNQWEGYSIVIPKK